MKEVIGLLVFICFSVVAIYFAVIKKIEIKFLIIILIFSVTAGYVIANHDAIERFKWGPLELESAKREISAAKESALSDIDKEIQNQKESIKLLMSNMNETKGEVYNQKESLNKLIETATTLQLKIEDQKNQIIKLNESAEKTKENIEGLNSAAKEIVLIHVRATYLSMITKNEFGTERAQRAIQEVLSDLNKILSIVFPDSQERSAWVEQLQSTLPPANSLPPAN